MTAPTVKCPTCKVDVPVDALDTPNRCHKNCPLNRRSIAADWLVIAFLVIAGFTNIASIAARIWGHL